MTLRAAAAFTRSAIVRLSLYPGPKLWQLNKKDMGICKEICTLQAAAFP